MVYASMHDITGRNAARARKERDYAQSRGVDLHIVELDVTSQESANQAEQAILAEQAISMWSCIMPDTWL
jgi:hypothetical protein